jgi:hypothetical protein
MVIVMILERYTRVHRQGSHCASSVLRTILQGQGYALSEDLCFGLGSGLGFTYQKYLGLDYYFFTGRNESLEENVGGVLGAYIHTGNIDDPEKGWMDVKQWIDAGIPVVLDMDMMYLPFLRDFLKLKKSFHFGLHSALLVGYDESRNEAYLLERLWNSVQVISLSDLMAARNSKDAPVIPDNRYKVIIFPEVKRDLSQAILDAIAINIHRMKEPYAFKMGLAGLKMFAREVPKWRVIYSESERKNHAYMAAALFEKVGTGGGNFRRMYARFLLEASEITQLTGLRNCADTYLELFRLWRRLIHLFEQGADDPTKGIYSQNGEPEKVLQQLVEKEYQAIEQLEQAIS